MHLPDEIIANLPNVLKLTASTDSMPALLHTPNCLASRIIHKFRKHCIRIACARHMRPRVYTGKRLMSVKIRTTLISKQILQLTQRVCVRGLPGRCSKEHYSNLSGRFGQNSQSDTDEWSGSRPCACMRHSVYMNTCKPIGVKRFNI